MLTRRLLLRLLPTTAALGVASSARAVPPQGMQPLTALNPPTLGSHAYAVLDDVTFPHDLAVPPGATIHVAAGRTLSLLGDLSAPRAHVFTGPGAVDLNHSRVLTAFPEWWGADASRPDIDSLPALEAALAAHPWLQLGEGEYRISRTWKITRGHCRVWGVGAAPLGAARGTRLVLDAGEGDIVQIGPDAFPGGWPAFPEAIDVRDLRIERTASVVPPALGHEANASAGVVMQYVLRAHLQNVHSVESSIGFVIRGVARSFVDRCEAYRTRGGTRRGNDIFFGFFLDGDARIGFAGGNASIYLTDCFAKIERHPPLAREIGAYLRGGFSDSFLTRFEMADMLQGIVVEGSAHDPDRELQRTGNGDLHIHLPVLDNCGRSCIELSGLTDYALVDIADAYLAPNGGALAAVHLHDSRGQLTLTGGQMLGPGATPANTIGLHVTDAEGFTLSGTKIRAFVRPVGVTRGRDFNLDVAINNPEQVAVQGALQFAGCDRAGVRARVKGRAGAFPQGIYLDGENHHLTLDVTGIDPACIQGGAANKLRDGATPIRVAGPFGTNLAEGVMD